MNRSSKQPTAGATAGRIRKILARWLTNNGTASVRHDADISRQLIAFRVRRYPRVSKTNCKVVTPQCPRTLFHNW